MFKVNLKTNRVTELKISDENGGIRIYEYPLHKDSEGNLFIISSQNKRVYLNPKSCVFVW